LGKSEQGGSEPLARPHAPAPRARHTRPNGTNQAAASSAWPRRAARHPWFRSDPSVSAEVTTDLPFTTATALSHRVTGPPPPMRALCPLNCPPRTADRGVCPRRELRPAHVAVGWRGPAHGPCTPPTRRQPNPRAATPSAGRAHARRRAGRALPAPWRAEGVSMGHPRALLRTGGQGKGGGGGRFTPSAGHDVAGGAGLGWAPAALHTPFRTTLARRTTEHARLYHAASHGSRCPPTTASVASG